METESCGCDDSVISSGYVCCVCYEASLKAREALRADREKLVAALRFYANGDAFCPDYDSLREEGDSDQCNPDSDCLFKGKLARETLKELGEL